MQKAKQEILQIIGMVCDNPVSPTNGKGKIQCPTFQHSEM